MKILQNTVVRIILIVLCAILVLFIARQAWQGFKGKYKGRVELVSTQVALERIRNVNKLLGAEYYGEVIADLMEVYAGADSAFEKYYIFYGLDSVHRKYKHYLDTKMNLLSPADSVYLSVLSDAFKYDGKQLSHRTAKIKNRTKYKHVVGDDNLPGKIQLAYLARGNVKAGIDLKQMTPDDIIIDPKLKLIRLTIPKSKITYADINPWFNVPKKIHGFTGIITKGITTFPEEKAVKTLCKIKLEKDAMHKGILAISDSSAKKTLISFFTIMGFKEVSVTFKESETLAARKTGEDTDTAMVSQGDVLSAYGR